MATKPSASSSAPFHAGERLVQARVGVRERLEQLGPKVIRDYMPDQHRELFCKLPFLLVGSLDATRRPWSSIVVGRPGFVQSPDPQTLEIRARPGPADPLGAHLAVGAPLGLLGIELETRRRNRMNGTVTELGAGAFSVRVDQSFGNCAQYIQARRAIFVADPSAIATPREVEPQVATLSARAAEMIQRADTFFIATSSTEARGHAGAEGVDVSHRGGRPGFVRVATAAGRTVLTSPDFRGNFMFNTLGNLALNPRAGLLFVDFSSGDLLSLTGTTEILWDGPEVAKFTGAERLLRFEVESGWLIGDGLPLRWSSPEPAREVARTGSWHDARRTP